MKRIMALLLAALLTLGLTACGGPKRLTGEVTELRTNDQGVLTAFVLEQRDGKRVGVALTEETSAFPPRSGVWNSDEELRADFQAALQPGCGVSVYYRSQGAALTDGEGRTLTTYLGQQVNIESLLERGAATLRDGTVLDLRVDAAASQGDRTYQLPEGPELLRVQNSGGPEHHYVAGQESFDDLSQAAQERVRAWYENQRPLFDEEAELENSYAAYLALGEDFHCDMILQDVRPASSNEKVMYFLTSLTLPQKHGERTVYETQLGAAFDRETGEKLSNWDLFAVPEEEVRRRFPELCGWMDEPELRAAMSEALEEDLFVFFPEYVTVGFPPGSLPGEAYSHLISLNYQDAPEGFFQPWAVPEARNE